MKPCARRPVAGNQSWAQSARKEEAAGATSQPFHCPLPWHPHAAPSSETSSSTFAKLAWSLLPLGRTRSLISHIDISIAELNMLYVVDLRAALNPVHRAHGCTLSSAHRRDTTFVIVDAVLFQNVLLTMGVIDSTSIILLLPYTSIWRTTPKPAFVCMYTTQVQKHGV